MSAELAERPIEMSSTSTGAWSKVRARSYNGALSTTKSAVSRSNSGQMTAADAVVEPQYFHGDINGATPSYDDEQYQSFINQRSVLIRKKLLGTLDRKEVLELRMIEWAIDRAELAAHDGGLRGLGRVAEMQEKLMKQINELNKVR